MAALGAISYTTGDTFWLDVVLTGDLSVYGDSDRLLRSLELTLGQDAAYHVDIDAVLITLQ